MALKDYIDNTNQCIINNHSEFTRLMKWFLKHGAEDCYGNDVAMFDNIYDICDELDVNHENYDYDYDSSDSEFVESLINNVSELEDFLLKNINKNTFVPSEDEYPILANWWKEEGFDRVGSSSVKILNFTPMSNIKPMKEYLVDFMKMLKVEKSKHREMCRLEREVRG